MCEWRIFLPKLLESDRKWIRQTAVLEQYEDSLTMLKRSLNASFEKDAKERTDRYYVGTDNIGLKNRAGQQLEIKIRKSMSDILVGGEHWDKFDLEEDPASAAKFQADIDSATARHELVDVIKSRRRDKKSPVRYEKTTVKIKFPVTEPANMLSNTYNCERSWVTVCVEGDDSRVLEELQSAGERSRLGHLRTCLLLCLRIRYDSVAHSCRESFFPVLSGYPSFLRLLTRPSLALLPAYTTPVLRLLDILPPTLGDQQSANLSMLPEALYASYGATHPLIAKYLHSPSSDNSCTWRTCPSSENLDSSETSNELSPPPSPSPTGSTTAARIVPYVPQDISTPADIVNPIRARRNGSLLNLDRVLLHSPRFAQGWNSLFGELRGSNMSIDAKHKELAICVVAILNEAEYEFYQHQPPWVSAGATEEQVLTVRLLGDDNYHHFMQARQEKIPLLSWTCFDAVELDIIQLTIEMTKYVKTSPELMKQLQGSLGGNAALVELAGVIAGYNMVSRFLVAMDINVEGEGED